MEQLDGEVEEKENVEMTVDFSKQALKRIERATNEQQSAVTLILDNNEIQRLDNLETYPNLEKLSAVNNQLIRMYGVSHLVHLVSLNLSNNLLSSIEGLKNLTNLKYLYLAKNRIKTIEHLNCNIKLETIDLSENNIMRISDISFLENLKELNLHGNRISHLVQCDKYLPKFLEILTLNNNSLSDLNEISYLVHLNLLRELSIVNNPCLDFSEDQKFNYRPFLKNWCTSLVVLDNSPLDDIECLKAEWLYSQGRGRSFRPGEHAALIEYLISVCPREKEENAETEDVKKLKLILSKAQLHQQQLREQISTGKLSLSDSRPTLSRKKSVWLSERMVTSFQDSPSGDAMQNSDLMSRSLDSGIIRRSSRIIKPDSSQTPLQTSTTFIPIPDTLISPDVGHPVTSSHPTVSSVSIPSSRSSSRNSQYSTPEAKRKTSMSIFRRQSGTSSPASIKMSGKLSNSMSSTPLELNKNVNSLVKKGYNLRHSDRNNKETSEEDDSEILNFKLKSIHHRVTQRKNNKVQKTDKILQTEEQREEKPENDLTQTKAWKAAVCIQRRWRGYRARNLDKEVLTGCKNIQLNRMQDYLTKVVNDMEATRVALEGNRKLVILQMQAINSLWKKMSALQPTVTSDSDESKASLHNLVETCSALSKQVERLQTMMKALEVSSNPNPSIPIATQTEIVAVHTPQEDNKGVFPYNSNLKSVENPPAAVLPENVRNDFGDSANDSDSSGCAVKTVQVNTKDPTNEDDFPVSEFMDSNDSPFHHEELSKPSVKLNDGNEEKSFPVENESENAEGKQESHNL